MAKVVLRLPRDGVEIDLTEVATADGNVEYELTPYFYGQDAVAAVAYLTTYNDSNQPICTTVVQVSGSKGNFKLSDVTKKVSPRFASRKPRPEAPAEKPAVDKVAK